MKKTTLATIKSFIEKNKDELYIDLVSEFDANLDMIARNEQHSFRKTEKSEDKLINYTQGIRGAWFVGNGRDYFSDFENDLFKGYEVFNSCGIFRLAIKKEV